MFNHFSQHEYWSMKGFREVTNQPEAYLKEVLDDIAVMNKSGPYTGKWSLRDEFKRNNPAVAGGGDVNFIEIDDDEDDDMELEDVPLGK